MKSKKLISLFLLLLISNFIFTFKNNLYAQKNILLDEIKVKRLKKEEIHIKTSAYVCALKQENLSINEIRKNMINMFKTQYSKNDISIIRMIIQKMCPDESLELLFQ